MRCVYCGADVDEDASCLPNSRAAGSRNLIHTFNTQMSAIFELLSKVEHTRLADHLLRPDPYDLSYILDRLRPNASSSSVPASSSFSSKSGGALSDGGKQPALTGRAAMVKFGDKWSGDKSRHQDLLLSQTKVSINIDSSSDAAGSKAKAAKEIPSILLLNRTQEEDYATGGGGGGGGGGSCSSGGDGGGAVTSAANSYNRDSILLSQLKSAADEIVNNQNNAAAAAAAATAAAAAAASAHASSRIGYLNFSYICFGFMHQGCLQGSPLCFFIFKMI